MARLGRGAVGIKRNPERVDLVFEIFEGDKTVASRSA